MSIHVLQAISSASTPKQLFLVVLDDGTAFVLPPGSSSAVLLTDDQEGHIQFTQLTQYGAVSTIILYFILFENTLPQVSLILNTYHQLTDGLNVTVCYLNEVILFLLCFSYAL